jgi:hypothetical protein
MGLIVRIDGLEVVEWVLAAAATGIFFITEAFVFSRC